MKINASWHAIKYTGSYDMFDLHRYPPHGVIGGEYDWRFDQEWWHGLVFHQIDMEFMLLYSGALPSETE